MPADPRSRFLEEVRAAALSGAWVKLTLGRHRGADATLNNVFVRPVTLKAGPMLSFLSRHATRDVTKNYPTEEALARIEALVGTDFLDAHLFTRDQVIRLECGGEGGPRLHRSRNPVSQPVGSPMTAGVPASGATPPAHDRCKDHSIPADAPWLRSLGVTNPAGKPREGMSAKFRQIQKFAELLDQFVQEAGFGESEPLSVCDMGSGKGYLTFAAASILGARATVRGIEAREELAVLCNRIASEQGLSDRLSFSTGTIAGTPVERIDILIALHACDTATDDALAKGVRAAARLILAAPCCHKEVRPQLIAPPVLSAALRHGIFQERHAEFVTDALRARLLEWSGYRTQAFEFVSTEHTAKNLMIAAVRTGGRNEALAAEIRNFAGFYGVRHHALARQLGFDLSTPD